jgi:hypothetical protein
VALSAIYFAAKLNELAKKYTWLRMLPTVLCISLIALLLLLPIILLLQYIRDAVIFSNWRRRGVVPVIDPALKECYAAA